MAESASNTPRIFVKKGRDGEEQTREVTSPQAEVQARFDGFKAKTPAKHTSSTSSTGSRASTSSSS